MSAGRVRKIAEGVLPLGIQVVGAIQAELGIDGVNHVEVQNVVVYRYGRLQQKVLHASGQIRHGVKGEESRGSGIYCRNLAAVAERSARAGEIRKWIEDRNPEAAEISGAFSRRRHCLLYTSELSNGLLVCYCQSCRQVHGENIETKVFATGPPTTMADLLTTSIVRRANGTEHYETNIYADLLFDRSGTYVGSDLFAG